MKFITGLQAERLISRISEAGDPSDPDAKKAFQKLAKLGQDAIPKVFDALAAADKKQTAEYVEVIRTVISDKTLPVIVRGLAHGDPKTIQGTAWALSSSKRFNVNRLVDLLSEDTYSKSAIVDVLNSHKDRLNVRQLLAQIYNLQPSEKTAVFKLIDSMVTAELVPDLLARMDGKDPVVKMHLIDIVSRFSTPEVQRWPRLFGQLNPVL
jgi:hypothetical protein